MSQKQAPYVALVCPVHHKPLEKVAITQGDKTLGWLYVCPFGEWGSKKKNCEYVIDTDDEGNPIVESG